ncbi:endonuclease/exonuclease/phosphatase family protein [Halorhodospira halophila]|uniref:Endonuclease/exonuclease/phosphatase n=1 Tax=Halorhodospira halophila (strain DSM 244 / SL1) TaxID=349124 RepID=A1WZP4_HALHL|nr:endonuclease/exonuclease/phosphatase family protein [Halorhodospira halophila]ABM63156.1 Endonuclease/exonuclease/phosphatase [Halorhodospira halophila SL1]MBK1729335.1 endonuclease [Halorhodospira halophila]
MTNISYRLREGAYATLHPTLSPEAPATIRVVSYNIQNAIATSRYHHYFTRGWKHVLPDRQRQGNLERIGGWIEPYDLVGLQEVDAGSFRTGFMNQVEHLAYKADFPYWYIQTNRNMGRLAQQSNGLLARYRPAEIREHRLPGLIPGRGALQIRFGSGSEALNVIQVHMALGRRTRMRQMDFLAELVNAHRHIIVMGDLNCQADSPELLRLGRRTDLSEPIHGLHTFPSWRPKHNIDHILISSTLQVQRARVLEHALSDHLPIAMELALPEAVRLPAA